MRSGQDDEEYNVTLNGIEELVSDRNTYIKAKDDIKQSVVTKKNGDKDGSDMLRMASIGILKKKRSK